MSTVPAQFLLCAQRSPLRPFLSGDRAGHICPGDLSREQAAAVVEGLAVRLLSLGVDRGSKVAILSASLRDWALVELATMSLGASALSLPFNLPPLQVARRLGAEEIGLVVLDGMEQYAALEGMLDALPELVHVLSLEQCDELLPLTPAASEPGFLQRRSALVQPGDMACIPRLGGAGVGHRELLSSISSAGSRSPVRPGDRLLISLPVGGALQRLAAYMALFSDLEGIQCLGSPLAALGEASPQVLLADSSSLERLYEEAALRSDADVAGRTLFNWPASVEASAAMRKARGRPPSRRLELQRSVYSKLVRPWLRVALPPSLRCVVFWGGDPSPRALGWLAAAGLPVHGWEDPR
jgi:long-chain acyl-CoA synthetase